MFCFRIRCTKSVYSYESNLRRDIFAWHLSRILLRILRLSTGLVLGPRNSTLTNSFSMSTRALTIYDRQTEQISFVRLSIFANLSRSTKIHIFFNRPSALKNVNRLPIVYKFLRILNQWIVKSVYFYLLHFVFLEKKKIVKNPFFIFFSLTLVKIFDIEMQG